MALPLPTDDAELFADLLASLQTDDAPVCAESTVTAEASATSPSPSLDCAVPTAIDNGQGAVELLDGDAAELLDALYEPVLALDDRLALDGEDLITGLDGGVEATDAGQSARAPVGNCGGSDEGVTPTAAASTAPTPSEKPKAKRRTRRTNPNKAREEQRRELLSLRTQVVEMERQVSTLQARSSSQLVTTKPHDSSVDTKQPGGSEDNERVWTGVGLTDVWRQTCLRQIERRVKAERENARLKRALASQLEMTSAIQTILQKPAITNASEAVDVLKRRRTGPMGVPLSDPAVDKELFAQLIAETDASIGKIDAFLDANGLLDVDAPRRGTHVHEVDSRVVLDVFATSVLPYDWHFASCGVWNFYKGAQKHFGPVFGKKAQSVGPNEDTVLESFVIEISASDARADFCIRQVVKRYAQAQQQIIAWTLDSEPTELSNKSVNFGFRENGFVVCRPPRTWASEDAEAPPPVTVMQIGYRISPYMTGSRGQHLSLRANIDDIAQFMFTSLGVEIRAKLERIENLLLDEKRQA